MTKRIRRSPKTCSRRWNRSRRVKQKRLGVSVKGGMLAGMPESEYAEVGARVFAIRERGRLRGGTERLRVGVA